jgi:chemotaxis protein MotA
MLMIVGALVVLVAVAGGYVMEGGHLLVLNQPAEFFIIGGAALGALLISTPPIVVKRLLTQVTGLFKAGPTKEDYLDLLSMLYQMFKLTQQSGVMALEAHCDDPEGSPIMSKYPRFLANHHAVSFLTDSIKVIILGGIASHDLEALMDEDLEVHHLEETKPFTTLSRISDSLPGLGIVAAVLGVVITMGAIDGPPGEIGHKVAAALVGTFLGILLCYGFVGPLAANLESVVERDARYLICMKTGLLAIYKGFAPTIAVEFARRVIPNQVRPAFDETEQYCRTGASSASGAQAEAA